MPGRTRVYDRIPTTSAEARTALGDARSVVLGYMTTLRLVESEFTDTRYIALRHFATDIVHYHPNGDISLHLNLYYTRTTIQRVRRVLPRGWTMIRRYGRNHPQMVYRGLSTFAYEDGWRFLADGGIIAGGYYRFSLADLDLEADERMPTLIEDVNRERGYRRRVRTRRPRAIRASPPPAGEYTRPITDEDISAMLDSMPWADPETARARLRNAVNWEPVAEARAPRLTLEA